MSQRSRQLAHLRLTEAAAVLSMVLCLVVAETAQAQDLSCASLVARTVPAVAIGLPTGGATVSSATVVAASPRTTSQQETVTAALPEYCKVLGAITSKDAAAPKINFQINLPTRWNGKAIQYGGGGFNGTLITGLNPLRDAPPDTSPPLAEGYVTFGTDSGHQTDARTEIQAFALNEEALINFAYASYKKTHDVALEIAKIRYGRMPSRVYYVGGSEGGREGLAMAQRFPADYDGVISIVPVIYWVGLQHAGHRTGIVQQNGGWLNPKQVSLLHKAVLGACDNLDNLADGVVSNYEGCDSVFDSAKLRCATGAGTDDTCLSDSQIRAVDTLHSPYQFKFPLANSVTRYPAFGYGGEDQQGGFPQWITASRPAVFPSGDGNGQSRQWYFGNGVIRYFVAGDPEANPFDYSPDRYAERVRYISELMDASSPDLSAFFRRGGKLIIKENMADYAQSPFAGVQYYKSVVTRMGQRTVDEFIRLYVTPGANHGGSGMSGTADAPIPQYIDLLSVLDAWVDKGHAPPEPVIQTARTAASPFTVTASRPMCRYPAFPRYKGSGDPNLASSFTCTTR